MTCILITELADDLLDQYIEEAVRIIQRKGNGLAAWYSRKYMDMALERVYIRTCDHFDLSVYIQLFTKALLSEVICKRRSNNVYSNNADAIEIKRFHRKWMIDAISSVLKARFGSIATATIRERVKNSIEERQTRIDRNDLSIASICTRIDIEKAVLRYHISNTIKKNALKEHLHHGHDGSACNLKMSHTSSQYAHEYLHSIFQQFAPLPIHNRYYTTVKLSAISNILSKFSHGKSTSSPDNLIDIISIQYLNSLYSDCISSITFPSMVPR